MQYARIKPFNGKTNKLRNFVLAGQQFNEGQGWYKVDDATAEYLKEVKQVAEDQFSPAAFDVVETLDEARAIDESERKRAVRALADDAQPTVRVHVASKNGSTLARAHRLRAGDKLDDSGNIIAPIADSTFGPGQGTLTTGRNGATHQAKSVQFYDDNDTELAPAAGDPFAQLEREAAAPPMRGATTATPLQGGNSVEGTATSGSLSTSTKIAGSEGDQDEASDEGKSKSSRKSKSNDSK